MSDEKHHPGGAARARVTHHSSLITPLFAALLAATPAAAQQYPVKPIRLIVPFPAGGIADVFARVIGGKLSDARGQQVVVENRPGAGGNIGAEAVAKSPPVANVVS